jgi:hypothetical protein
MRRHRTIERDFPHIVEIAVRGATIFSDLIGRLDMLRVAWEKVRAELPRDFIARIFEAVCATTLSANAREYRRNRTDCFQLRVARFGSGSRSF